jgi:hypothetical protein
MIKKNKQEKNLCEQKTVPTFACFYLKRQIPGACHAINNISTIRRSKLTGTALSASYASG